MQTENEREVERREELRAHRAGCEAKARRERAEQMRLEVERRARRLLARRWSELVLPKRTFP